MTTQPRRHSRSRRNLLVAAGSAIAGLIAVRRRAGAADQSTEPIPQAGDPVPDAFIRRAFEMRDLASANGDQGYGALIVNGSGRIVGQAPSRVVTNGDPTAHAEMEAIRDAAQRLGTRNLAGHVMYSSTRPCPMCEAAAYWAGVSKLVYGRDGEDGGSPRLCG